MFKERIYKIWKQFTTQMERFRLPYLLCSKNEYTKSESNSQPLYSLVSKALHCVQRTNIQNLKAIHNYSGIRDYHDKIVFKERIYKIWKQFTTEEVGDESCVELCSKNEYTKSESNSQLSLVAVIQTHKLCSKNEYTKSESNSQLIACCLDLLVNCVQRTNIQNLKAIHNYCPEI